ncbi:MAG TPA: choice-of-anchor tandem repeat GloVer-containing protein [Rhizomicrobium sp.]
MHSSNCQPLAAAAVVAALAGFAGSAQASGTLETLYSFCSSSGCPDGDQPYAGVTLESSGRLLGTTGFGGKYSGGTVFALDDRHGSWTLKSLKSFCVGKPPNCQSDQGPSVTLVVDTSGNIYGTAYFAGAGNDGAVFELESKGGNKYALHYIHTFAGSDGAGPWDISYAGQNTGAPYDGKSPLYGATIAGGTAGNGTVYSLTPGNGGWNFQTLYNFCGCSDGGLPRGAVLVGASGALYGTTGYYGNNSAGTIYELTQSGGIWSETTLYEFCGQANCADGNGPFAGLAQDTSGNLYGTTYFGGNAGDGVVFEFSSTSQYSVLYSFCAQTNCTDGSEPAAPVTLDSKGDIFGTAGRGGDGNFGAMFEIKRGAYARLYSFCALSGCSDGGYPYGALALDSKGRLYGTTQYGGARGLGSVYRLKP